MTLEQSTNEYSLSVESTNFSIPMTNNTAISVSRKVPEYEGEYEITPSDSIQVLQTEELMMKGNLIINPIPSGYGKIGWDGQVLSVS